jgi:hypothetical protein
MGISKHTRYDAILLELWLGSGCFRIRWSIRKILFNVAKIFRSRESRYYNTAGVSAYLDSFVLMLVEDSIPRSSSFHSFT